MTLHEFIRTYELPPLVPIKRVQKLLVLGNTKFHDLVNQGVIDITKVGPRSFCTVEHVYELATSLPHLVAEAKAVRRRAARELVPGVA
jgi:hypothetical protein